jgi:hypothetical protein
MHYVRRIFFDNLNDIVCVSDAEKIMAVDSEQRRNTNNAEAVDLGLGDFPSSVKFEYLHIIV